MVLINTTTKTTPCILFYEHCGVQEQLSACFVLPPTSEIFLHSQTPQLDPEVANGFIVGNDHTFGTDSKCFITNTAIMVLINNLAIIIPTRRDEWAGSGEQANIGCPTL